MINICLVGACGRMGQRIIAAIVQTDDMRLSGAVEQTGHPSLGRDAGEVAGLDNLGVSVTDNLEVSLSQAQVVIDFSLPASVVKSAGLCSKKKIPLVTGVTGIPDESALVLKEASSNIPVVWAPNMSVGVNLMFKTVAQVAAALGDDFDVEIYETHHRFKRDAPSGTAKRLAEIIAKSLGRDLNKVGCYGREGITGERDRKEIAVHSIRAGDVVGEHTAVFGGLGERFEITHKAHSRDMFARGAVIAARFAAKAKNGMYDMQDVLGFKD